MANVRITGFVNENGVTTNKTPSLGGDSLISNCSLLPTTNNSQDLGSSLLLWRNIYADQINAKQRDIKLARYNTDSTNLRFIRWVTTGVNNNTEASGSSCLIVPKNGTLESIQIRTKSISNSTAIGFHRVGNGVGIPIDQSNFTLIETQTLNITSENTVFTANFSNASFTTGDIIGVSVNPTNATDDVLMTIILIFDWNT
jgi:hypothetical protein